MPDLKISELPAADLPLGGDELVEVVQGGLNKQTESLNLGIQYLDELFDVDVAGAVAGDVLAFDGTGWVPQAAGGGGGDAIARGSVFYPDNIDLRPGAIALFFIDQITGGTRIIFDDGVFGDNDDSLSQALLIARPQVSVLAEGPVFDDSSNEILVFTIKAMDSDSRLSKFFVDLTCWGVVDDFTGTDLFLLPPSSVIAHGKADPTSAGMLLIRAQTDGTDVGFECELTTNDAPVVFGDRLGDINDQVSSLGNDRISLTRLRMVDGGGGTFNLELRIRGQSLTPMATIFNSLSFEDKDGNPVTLLRTAATTTTPVNRTRQWVWANVGEVFEDEGEYEFTFA